MFVKTRLKCFQSLCAVCVCRFSKRIFVDSSAHTSITQAQPFRHILCVRFPFSLMFALFLLLPKTNEKSCYSLNQFPKVLFSCSKRIINTQLLEMDGECVCVCVGIVFIPYVVDLVQQKRYYSKQFF